MDRPGIMGLTPNPLAWLLALGALLVGGSPALAALDASLPSGGAAFEAPTGNSTTLGAFGGLYNFDSGQDLGLSTMVGVRAGVWFDGGPIGLEEYLLYSPAKGKSGARDNQYFLLGVELLYSFAPGSKFTPFLAGGVGVAAFDPRVETESRRTLGTIGGGVRWSAAPKLVFRLDGRFLRTLSGTKRGNGSASFGVDWNTGD